MNRTCLGLSLLCSTASLLFVCWMFLAPHERAELHGYSSETLLKLAVWFAVPSLGVLTSIVPLVTDFRRRLAAVSMAINLLSHPLVILGAIAIVAMVL